MSVYSDFTFFSENGVLTGRSFVRTNRPDGTFTRFFFTPSGELDVHDYDGNNVQDTYEVRLDGTLPVRDPRDRSPGTAGC